MTKVVGLLLALLLVIYVFISLPQNLIVFQNMLTLAISALWFVLIGRMLTNKTEHLPRLLSFPPNR